MRGFNPLKYIHSRVDDFHLLTKFDEMPAPGGARHLGNGTVGHLVLVIVDQRHPGGSIGEMFLAMLSYYETDSPAVPGPADRTSGLSPSSRSTETLSTVGRFPSPPLSSSPHLSASAASAHCCPHCPQCGEREVCKRCRGRAVRL